jgi:hypothetical protein
MDVGLALLFGSALALVGVAVITGGLRRRLSSQGH